MVVKKVRNKINLTLNDYIRLGALALITLLLSFIIPWLTVINDKLWIIDTVSTSPQPVV